MAIGFQINRDMLNDFTAHKMPAEEFVRQFNAAARGDTSVYLAKFVRPWHGRLAANEWKPIRAKVFARDDYTCRYCGKRGERLECDHIVPVARGGSHDIENLATACRPCNRSKHAKTPEQWRGKAA